MTWPDPGEWLEVETVDPCRAGVHACRVAQLPYWLRPELWEVELDGEVVEGELMVIAPRGRLVRCVEAWNRDTEREFGRACVVEARKRVERSPELEPFAVDVEQTATSATAFAAFATARLAELQDGTSGYDAERIRQSGWLAHALAL